jgi:precorrin-6A/cobalt-precorrin-6A reductase
MTPRRLLLLGGTTEALALAERLAGDSRLEVISSLAGRTVAHRLPPGRVRVGGFGGVAGLKAFLDAEKIGLVIDATHPFAAAISRHAASACAEAKVPRLQVLRPAWQPEPGDHWIPVPTMVAAAAALPDLARVAFLAIGRQELAIFAGLKTVRLVVRMVDAPAQPLPLENATVILARGPYGIASEEALFTEHGIEVVVSKNSGGDATIAKLTAARRRGLPVVMIQRPEAPGGDHVETVAGALAWLKAQ